MESTVFAVMSYNRRELLKNCVESIERHVDDPNIVIVDDGSTCNRTLGYLHGYSRKYAVTIRDAHENSRRSNGLWNNMETALYKAAGEFEYIFYIQDDMQIVRKCDPEFLLECKAIFNSDKNIVQIVPCFFKGFFPRKYFESRYAVNEAYGYYDDGAYGFSDTGLTSISRLLEKNYRFGGSEAENSALAGSLGFRSVLARNPVMMFTPWPPTERRGSWKSACAERVVEWGLGAGCNPFEDMTAADVERLLARSVRDFPIAEDYLRTKKALRKPWWYTTCYDAGKLADPRYLLTLKWLREGPPEYGEWVSKKRLAGEAV